MALYRRIFGDRLMREQMAASKRQRAAARASPPVSYCTKHVYSGRRLVPLYGGIHRTPGNACDGAEHRRDSLMVVIGDNAPADQRSRRSRWTPVSRPFEHVLRPACATYAR